MSDIKAMLESLQRAQANSQRKTKNANAEHESTRDITDNIVTKSHALTRAYYRYSLAEKRVMEALISKLHPQRTDNLQSIELKATAYAKAYNIAVNHAYQQLAQAIDALQNRKIVVKNSKGTISYVVAITAQYVENEGRVFCTLHPDITPHLVGLRAKFSSYPLKMAVNFKSTYTWRFYELLVSWAQPKKDTNGLFAGWFSISVDELRLMLGVPDSYNYGKFSKQVITVVTQELEKKANIKLFTERVKTSRRITGLKFQFAAIEQPADKKSTEKKRISRKCKSSSGGSGATR